MSTESPKVHRDPGSDGIQDPIDAHAANTTNIHTNANSGVYEEAAGDLPHFPEDTKEEDLDLPKECFLLQKQNNAFQIPYYLTSLGELSKVRPPAVVQTWEARHEQLDAAQKEKYETFVGMVKEARWYDPKTHDSWCCLRYLIARHFDVNKSFHMIEKTAEWLKETGSASWTCEHCMENPNDHLGQFVGWDREHRPVMFMSMRWGPERKHPLRHMVTCFNHLISLMPVGVEKWVCVTDFETYSHFKDSKPSMGISVIQTIQNHYPERLGKMICINPPGIFWVLWKLFHPVIDPVTRSKVEFLYTEDKPSVYDTFPALFGNPLRSFLYDSYHRSKRDLPAEPLVWLPDPDGYPKNYEERKVQLKEMKEKGKEVKKAAKEKKEEEKKADHEAKKAAKKEEKKHH
ncbi:cellular retinaldehyde-binding protein/triple function domain-containing protein [Strigomonas culicis]|uniref:Cellular retinaldehyde-binding protein/triple function domain-containing protein n=1 Tax=Strigomonas culicis TaxID=28005 RepID=S9UXZ4_9TRYP|nr:cellular retinaldehyde-binding protein/triple function domain-containing protein [Strigomonas culicis]EPY35727.1 cellular retinaldehyde-binding protein/triple function domain-containing protein [Strigomonas culicis]|eukprot:EPY20870.1 cellular retinaldehyde-binding protein/triple function domain-containing protein [Strigomonas culicis]